MPDVGIIVLAAGGSTRMGRPKQLLQLEGVSLLRRAALAAVDSGCKPIAVVLGAEAMRLHDELAGLPIVIAINPQWQAGIGSSIRCGVQAVRDVCPSLVAIAITLADQPFVTGKVIRRLIDSQEKSGAPVCIAGYNDTIGPPVVVAAKYFPSLLNLPNDRGAKGIWETHQQEVLTIPCPEGGCDIDLPADYARIAEGPS